MMKRARIASLTLLLAVVACGGTMCRAGGRAGSAATAQLSAPQGAGVSSAAYELPLPSVPAGLTEPADRADYIIEHFWDAMEFRDTLRSRNGDFIEQTFVNFISVFPYARPDARRKAVSGLMKSAESDSEAYLLLADIAERYLYESDSPMLDEDTYILFLEEFLASPVPDSALKIRPRYQLEAARKNRAGMLSADFFYIDREGVRRRMHKFAAGRDLLLLFYDPDCEHCMEVVAMLAADEVLQRRVAEGTLAVLAVYADGERGLWESTMADMPAGWEVGLGSDDIYDRGLYVLRTMPSLYLLDGKRRVVVKDAKPEMLPEYLSE